MPMYSGPVHVHRLSERGAEVSTFSLPDARFWLPREGHASWAHPPRPGQNNTVVVPEWLRAKQKQMINDPTFTKCGSSKPSESTALDREGSGALYRNEDKQGSKRPDYRGHVVIEGKRYKLAGWLRNRKQGGGKFLSLAAQPADEIRQ